MILRIVAALFMIYGHGWSKLMQVLNGNLQFMDPIGLGPEISLILAAFAEAICAFFILVGYYTRLAAAFLIINMSVAIFSYHLPTGDSFGGMEKALLFLLIWIIVFLMGPGNHSIDQTRS